MWAMVYSAESQKRESFLVTACAVSSACAGMSVNANFSFAFVNLAAMPRFSSAPGTGVRTSGSAFWQPCILPGAIVVAIVSGYALVTYPSRRTDLRRPQPARDVRDHYRRFAVSRPASSFLAPLVFPLVVVTGLVWSTYSAPRIAPLGWAAAAIFAVTLAIHWTAFRLFGLLLPKDRTAIYFFPLFMIFAGALAAIPPHSRLGPISARKFHRRAGNHGDLFSVSACG